MLSLRDIICGMTLMSQTTLGKLNFLQLNRNQIRIGFKLSSKRQLSWRRFVGDKFRVLWLSNGDRNTKKFHQVANSPRTFNSITNLLVDGELTTNPATIFESITQFRKRLYTGGIPKTSIGQAEVFKDIRGECRVVEQTLRLRSFGGGKKKPFNGDKAPRPYGFSMVAFFLKVEVVEIFQNFHAQGKFEKSNMLLPLPLSPKNKKQ